MLPRSVKIGAHEYRIETASRKELGPNSADVDVDQNTIRIVRGVPRSRKVELVLHEAIHAMLPGEEFKEEEAIVLILGEAMTRFLADNPFFVVEALKILADRKKLLKAFDKALGKS